MTLPDNTEVILCIGSNCGDRKGNVAAGIEWLSGILTDFCHSSIYATPDCHGGMREYMNAVCAGTLDISPCELDIRCKDYELECGRDAEARTAGDVPIDVDIVVYNGRIIRDKDFRCEFFQKGFRQIKGLVKPLVL